VYLPEVSAIISRKLTYRSEVGSGRPSSAEKN